MFLYSETQREEIDDPENDVDDELVLIGIDVAEEEGPISTAQFDTSVHFPAPRSVLSGGTSHTVLMPDSGLSRLYSDDRLEVYHAPTEIAKCLLDNNYLPPEIFGREADIDIRADVFDRLGLEDRGVSEHNQEYKVQLRELAGEDDPEVEEQTAETEQERLTSEYKYSELQTRAKELGIEDARQSKDDLADYIAEHRDD